MSWRLKLANLISGGLVAESQRQAKSYKAKLDKAQINIDNLKKQLQYAKRETEQAQAQLLMAKGFHAELGETQLKLKETANKLLQCQQQLKQQQAVEPISTERVNAQDSHQHPQETVDVIEVKRLPLKDFDALWGFSIASPKAGTKIQGSSIRFQGWVLGKKALATKIRINYQDTILVEAPISLPSPGVTQYYPDIAAAEKSGFETSLSVVDLPTSAEIEIQAELENKEVVGLSVISLQH